MLENCTLDTRYFFPKVLQAVATDDFMVYAYLNDGTIRKVDMNSYFSSGRWEELKDINIFKTKLTVLNETVAWDLDGTYDNAKCLDLDPCSIYEQPFVSETEVLEAFSI